MAGQFALGISLAMFLKDALAETTDCKYIPGDYGWPSNADWAQLNNTVGGRLIATVPQASVCHTTPYSNYDEAKCQVLAARWNMSQTYTTLPAEIMNPYFQNQSCDPFTPISRPCELGNYAVYSINVTGASDVIAGINFAKEKNVRLVIKNTGHDYVGRSTGEGALSLWMWNLKTLDPILQYNKAWYSGPALKMGAGVVSGEAYTAASAAGYRVVGGECPTVGLAGGYSQGGGHSLLSTAYGMGADQILEWEVVTADGEHLVATPEENSDLYWALSGGGVGNYGVVLSMTARMHSDGPVGGGALSFANTNNTAYWEAISLWFQMAPTFNGEKNTVIHRILKDSFQAAFTLPDQSSSGVDTLLSPFLGELSRLNITYNVRKTDFGGFLDHFNAYYGPLPYGSILPTTTLMSRLLPKSVANDADVRAAFISTLQPIVADSFVVTCVVLNVTTSSHPANAVLPAWRETVTGCNMNAYWNYTAPLSTNLAVKKRMVDTYVPSWEAATPGGAAYLNEMDPWYHGDWKPNLYGENYDRLLGIKHTIDPSHLFWGVFAVGSDELFVDESGRLCKA